MGDVVDLCIREGFEPIEGSGPEKLVFIRGTWLSTVMAYSPKQWKVALRIYPDSLDGIPRLCIEMDVTTSGQIVSLYEREYFIALLKQLHQDLHAVVHRVNVEQAMVLYGQHDHAMVKEELATKQNIVTALSFFFVFPVLLLLLASLMGMPWFVAVCISFISSMTVWNIYLFSKKP